MKRILLLLSIPAMLVSVAVCQQPGGISPTERRYWVSSDGFSVLLDAYPALTTAKVSRKDGTERTKRLITTTIKGVFYNIEIFENLKPGQSLEEFIAEINTSLQYDPATWRNLTVDGFPGKEYSSQNETTTIVMQFFATQDRLFRFTAVGPASATTEIKHFFSSIEFGEPKRAIDLSIYIGRDVDVKARLLKKPEPNYTKDARHNRVEGTVVLKAVFSKEGRVTNIWVFEGLPYGLTERAIKAAKGIKFIPAMKDGKPVSMWMQLEYNFSLGY